MENFWFNDSTGRIPIEVGSNASSTPEVAVGGKPYPANETPTVQTVTGVKLTVGPISTGLARSLALRLRPD